ncbi:uncharacterized protein [Amphiura filiformis]|uniref:uncharacterized protein n=1 Tax=Amphiura filiformis TaxID=82378 RepID=UPI003B20E04F
MAVPKQKKKTPQEVIPEINSSLLYLRTCDDFSTKNAFKHFRYLRNVLAEDTSPCDNIAALENHVGKSGIGQLFPTMWKTLSIYLYHDHRESQGFANLRQMLAAFVNITNGSPECGLSLGKCSAITLLFAGLKQINSIYNHDNQKLETESLDDATESIFIILHNTIRLCPSNLTHYRNNNAVSILNGFLKLDSKWQFFSLLVLAYITTDLEKNKLASAETGVRNLINLLKEAVRSDDHFSKGTSWFSAFEILDAINQLAINDDVKNAIENEGGIPFIIQMLQDNFSAQEQKVAAEALWNLSFIDSLRKSDILQATIPTLKKLTKSKHKELRGVCASALFEIQGEVTIDPSSSPSSNTPRSPPPSYQEAISEPDPSNANRSVQVMISYQWDSQERAVQIRDRLVATGYKVWMDVTNMRGDILSAMADAVQKSDVILICMTEQYKDSQSCRSEASYAYKLNKKRNKKIIPLLLQDGYEPDGWLGLLQGMDLYYAFHSDDQLNKNMGELLKAIGEYSGGDEVDGPIGQSRKEMQGASPNASPIKQGNPNAGAWSREEVQSWLKDNELTELCEKFRRFNGTHLQDMYSRCCKYEEKLRDELESDYELKGADRTVFVVALKQAFME